MTNARMELLIVLFRRIDASPFLRLPEHVFRRNFCVYKYVYVRMYV